MVDRDRLEAQGLQRLIKLNREQDCLFVLLWWLTAFLLWYIGVVVWVSIIVGALIGWILRGILTEIGALTKPYKITRGQAIADMPIHFQMPLWRKLIAVLLPIKPETLKATVRYLYEDSDTWWYNALWRETGSFEITIIEQRTAHISVLQYDERGAISIEGKHLPSYFVLEVRIRRVSNNQIRAEFAVPLTIN